MNRLSHRIYISLLTLITLSSLVFLIFKGSSYYNIILEERFFHGDHQLLKPSGFQGHAYGIFGTLFVILGIVLYMARKRFRFLSRLGILKHWLEFHIFLCVLGPILILFHTSFKFGGLIAISFWSMVMVFLSGIVGRFIYIQIPRTIEGRELSLNEVRAMRNDVRQLLINTFNIDSESVESIELIINQSNRNGNDSILKSLFHPYNDVKILRQLKSFLKGHKITQDDTNKIIRLVKDDFVLKGKIARLTRMQNMFKYWHVVHMPFALVMIVIMLIHVIITIVFGYKWIF